MYSEQQEKRVIVCFSRLQSICIIFNRNSLSNDPIFYLHPLYTIITINWNQDKIIYFCKTVIHKLKSLIYLLQKVQWSIVNYRYSLSSLVCLSLGYHNTSSYSYMGNAHINKANHGQYSGNVIIEAKGYMVSIHDTKSV